MAGGNANIGNPGAHAASHAGASDARLLPPRAVIGMVHIAALPGTPMGRLSVRDITARAVAETQILVQAGFDAIIIENMHDRPYVHGRKSPETVAAMTVIGAEVRRAARRGGADLPMGVQVLSGGNAEAIAVAHAIGAQFVRCENFVFAHVADEGLLAAAEAGELLRYRRSIGAEQVRVLTDIKKKHASHAITADVTIAEAVRAAEFFLSDGVIVTGVATGAPASPDDVAEARNATALPVLVGSGVTPETVIPLLTYADGLIVGSFIKQDGLWSNPLDAARCVRIVKARDASR